LLLSYSLQSLCSLEKKTKFSWTKVVLALASDLLEALQNDRHKSPNLRICLEPIKEALFVVF